MRLAYITEAKVRQVIALAENLNAAFPPSESGIDASSRQEAIRRADAYTQSPERKALIAYMKGLSEDELAELTALMWLGRGDNGDDLKVLTTDAKKDRPGVPVYFAQGLGKIAK